MSDQYWGIDLGGTKIEGAVLTSTETPDPLCRIRIDTQAKEGTSTSSAASAIWLKR